MDFRDVFAEYGEPLHVWDKDNEGLGFLSVFNGLNFLGGFGGHWADDAPYCVTRENADLAFLEAICDFANGGL